MRVPVGCILGTTDGFTDLWWCSGRLIPDTISDESQQEVQFLAGGGHSNRRTAGTMSTDSRVLRDVAHLTSTVTAGPTPLSGRITTNAFIHM